ncbi:uncharacterized protein DUF2827 [Comamonas sp. BIGb0124]|uniref:DUF2827 domain-containing protein n=1 Tax=Comamonas sp. BIGb0124 TaxID=2485130 RepID=UPI000F4630BE|nr:DUF2827 domain-containing protein [Comamonas sp. BIGb0124]ROR18614.1 uncharacterized protein DUF2827 [Comamonas sp. BIGb0124]
MRQNLRVGITLMLRDGPQSVWENGIFQNCFYLAMLLQASPVVSQTWIVHDGAAGPDAHRDLLAHSPAPVMDLATAQQRLDVVIELSAQLAPDWSRAFHARGGRVVAMHVANDYVIDIERIIYGLPPGMQASGTPYDAVWTLPAFEHSCTSYYQHVLRAPVSTMPHLWSPAGLIRHLRAQGRAEVDFDYRPGRDRWRLAVCEPNLCMVKTCHLPMLLCDAAHRAQPDFIEHLRVYNAMGLKENALFVRFARSLDLVNHGLASFEPRLPITDILGPQADALVSHHWENGQNYLYYEALWGGWPLIHNSAWLGDCGYRYPDFDCLVGGVALRTAFGVHDAQLVRYRQQARQFLAALDPCAPPNVAHYGAALQALFQS